MAMRFTTQKSGNSSVSSSLLAHICSNFVDITLGLLCLFGLSLIVYGLYLLFWQDTTVLQFFDLISGLTTFVLIVGVVTAIWLAVFLSKTLEGRFRKPTS